uniref:Uncharacterized protein n=1 Tax=Anguilla anguilla TaxID=7936 RepID=A0A0E9QUJ8_ANGAN
MYVNKIVFLGGLVGAQLCYWKQKRYKKGFIKCHRVMPSVITTLRDP